MSGHKDPEGVSRACQEYPGDTWQFAKAVLIAGLVLLALLPLLVVAFLLW
jgi:hypothetical protein